MYKNFFIAFVLFTSILFSNYLFAVPIIDSTTSSSSVSVGDNFDISFRISGLSSLPGDELAGFDVDIFYDPSLVNLVSYSFDDPVLGNQLDIPEAGAFPFLGDAFDFGGIVDAFAITGNSSTVLESQQSLDFTFLTLSFEALTPGGALFSLDGTDPFLAFLDANFIDLSVDTSNTLTYVNITSGSTTTVSEPGMLGLLGIGLIQFFLIRRKKRGLNI